jgi:predicted Zn-dependent protease
MAVLGSALIRDGRRAEGIAYLERAFAIGPRRPAVWNTLADGFAAANETARAESCRRRAAALVSSP